MPPFLSIITPVYNSPETTEAFLDSVFASTYKNFELIIVDDGSSDQFQDIFKGRPVVFKRLPQRKGAYFARHEGIKEAQGEVLVFLDADVLIKPETLAQMVELLEHHPEASGLLCSYDDEPAATNVVSQFKFLYHHYIHQHEGMYVGSFWTGCGAIKKDVFEKLGGFSVQAFHNPNAVMDIDFGYRLNSSHYKIYNAREIQVKHLKRLTFSDWFYTDILTRGLPWMKIMLRYRNFHSTLNVNSMSCLSVICVWLMIAVAGYGFISPHAWSSLPLFLSLFLVSNYQLLDFFYTKRGFRFMIQAIGLLWIYYFNCGLCVILGLIFYNKI
jgi:glycosyltransferase involved in cell wall biosynthesis